MLIYVIIFKYRCNDKSLLKNFQKLPFGTFQNFYQMSNTDFYYLLENIYLKISKNDTCMRQCN